MVKHIRGHWGAHDVFLLPYPLTKSQLKERDLAAREI